MNENRKYFYLTENIEINKIKHSEKDKIKDIQQYINTNYSNLSKMKYYTFNLKNILDSIFPFLNTIYKDLFTYKLKYNYLGYNYEINKFIICIKEQKTNNIFAFTLSVHYSEKQGTNFIFNKIDLRDDNKNISIYENERLKPYLENNIEF